MLPLELGGRRVARIAVAKRELEMREQVLTDRERMLASEVRAKFGEALAEVLKLGFTEELLAASRRGYKLVVARVVEGRTAPLEQNMVLVEVNRLRSMRETSEGKVQVAMLELRNLMGMNPEAPNSMQRRMTAGSSLAETTTTGTLGYCALRYISPENPRTPGMARSSRTRSASPPRSRIFATSSNEPASATSIRPSRPDRASRSAPRNNGWSSAMTKL